MKPLILFVISVGLFVVTACNDHAIADDDSIGSNDELSIPDWSEDSHSNNVEPNYTEVFPQDEVNSLEITMTSSDWTSIQANMQTLFGFGFGAGGMRGGGFPDNEPNYVAVSVKANGLEWYKVGFRLKGNSTLSQAWSSGIYKLPFRLNFDRYEDTYLNIKNQRFYGFKEFSLSPAAKDNSLIREKIASDIFRKAGVPAPQTSFYRVYIDFGSGKKYCGVYTLIEVVDDTMVKDQFGEDAGNIYKPESYLKTYSQNEMNKKNNEDLNDYSDVQSFVATLNSSLRISKAEEWRTNLETTFHVDHFLKWLAVNTTMTNWDTYGAMAHNFYLYNHSTNKLTWIPWDNNEALASRNSPNGGSVTLPLTTVSSNWPLIRYLADDPVFYARYKQLVREFADNTFTAEDIQSMMEQYYTLISPYVIGPIETESGKYTWLSNSTSFTAELSTLKQYVVGRHAAVDSFVP
jgi:spore coat protein H